MKLISKLAVTSAVLALAFISTASAQSMRVNVPFGFHAGEKSLPAGTYEVAVSQKTQLVKLTQLDGKSACMLVIKAFDGTPQADHGSLVFNHYGSSYFLTRVKAAGVEGGAQMFTSRAERESAQVRPAAKETVYIASGK